MEYDPISEVEDEPLHVSPEILSELTSLRASEHFERLPGVDTGTERQRLITAFESLIDRLQSDLPHNPQKLWIMKEFQVSLTAVQVEDSEAREHFGIALERVMDILGIESSNGLLSFYLGGI